MAVIGPILQKVERHVARHSRILVALLLAAETALTIGIIHLVSYTEIDWFAYIQQARLVAAGERDYSKIRGDSGPIVYPALHSWIFVLLDRVIANALDSLPFLNNDSIRLAQYIYASIYIATLTTVLSIYLRLKSHVSTMLMTVLSRRLHSIYVLRLFNDCFAMLGVYVSILLLLKGRRSWSIAAFSLAVGIKMNALLFAPGIIVAIITTDKAYCGFPDICKKRFSHFAHLATKCTAIFFAIQAAIAWPFMRVNSRTYLASAFNLARVFEWQWTVNWRFLGKSVFESPMFRKASFAVWILSVCAFLSFWIKFISYSKRQIASPSSILTMIFTVNLIGILTARTLHYQFYSWYFFTIPYLLQKSLYPIPIKLAIFCAIEYSWNVFPSTKASSLVLFIGNCALLAGIIHRLVSEHLQAPITHKKKAK